MRIVVCITFVFFMSSLVHAADYDVDLGSMSDLEELRPLIDQCGDIGEIEDYRSALESASDLEDLRSFLEDIGYVQFRDCPAQIEGSGIEWVD